MEKPFTRRFRIEGRNFVDAGKASTEIKTILKELGLPGEIVRKVAIATYEAEMNVVMYAREAQLVFEVSPEKITITLDDRGPGIADIGMAMQEGYSTATNEMREMGFGAGLGLSNIEKNSDDLVITSQVGVGTKLVITININ